jgi:hypothetical protein
VGGPDGRVAATQLRLKINAKRPTLPHVEADDWKAAKKWLS